MSAGAPAAQNAYLYFVDMHDPIIAKRLLDGDEKAFEQAYVAHFGALHGYAFTFLHDDVLAEEAVQNVFLRIWKRRESLGSLQPLKPYLYRAVRNESLNILKHRKVERTYAEQLAPHLSAVGHDASEPLLGLELKQRIAAALEALPEQCGRIFRMSRFEELRYQDIADVLGISVKTVENQMGKALKIMRTKLAEYLPLLPVVLKLYSFLKTGGWS